MIQGTRHPVALRILGEMAGGLLEGLSNEDGAIGKGIHFICNGWTLSAQSGWGNYWSGDPARTSGLILTARTLREDCEIALWETPNGALISLGDDSVQGWVPWGDVIEIIHWLSRQPEKPNEVAVREVVLSLEEARRG